MTAFGRLFRTTVFKLSLAYFCIFAVGAVLTNFAIGFNVKQLLDAQIVETVEAEITGLNEQYAEGGIRQLVEVIERRARQPGSSLYLFTSFAGETLAGNVAVLPDGVLTRPGTVETSYRRSGDAQPRHHALARVFLLPGGFRLLVGRDTEEREGLRHVLGQALINSILFLGVVGMFGGLFVARRVLARVDAITSSAQVFMAGDLSGRLPVAGSNDELDRLARSLNSMLDRIRALLNGLKEVSDNIAHDLRTPLTRLRNGAERALHEAANPQEQRAALEKTIKEADGLIRIFDALLLIARAEAGSGRDGMERCDAAEIASGIAELYEPAAEAAGLALRVVSSGALPVIGNRELIGQSIANLCDNAIKYGLAPQGTPAELEIATARVGGFAEISVADRGPGIAPDKRERALSRFVRLEGSRSRPGSGLGLSLAAAVARLHGGTLRLEDNAPGLRVVLSLPLAKAAPMPPLPVLAGAARAALPGGSHG